MKAAVCLMALWAAVPLCGAESAGQDASRADLDYAHPPSRSEAGLPIGNGRMGTLVWTEPGAVRMQINRDDVFAVSGSSTSFPQRDTTYCCGCAGVRIAFGAAVFPFAGTTEHLGCGDGLAAIRGVGVSVEALAWADDDVIALRVDDRRPGAAPAALRLTFLRPAIVRTGAHTAASTWTRRPDGTQLLRQVFTEGAYYCASSVVARVAGGGAGGPELVYVASAASFDPKVDVDAAALVRLDAAQARGFDALKSDNDRWWESFWSRSCIRLHSADGRADRVEANYAYFLYLMGCTSRGDFPTKFNGMLWNTDGDRRKWGGAYWGANQSCYYNNALFAADHAELMEPMFDLYTRMAPAEELAARQEWGSRGIYFPETVTFDGLGALPPAIAAEMPGLYLLHTPWSGRSAAFRAYAAHMQPYTSRWNFMVGGHWDGPRWVYGERGYGPYGPTSHILSRGAKIAYQYWQRYEYTQDRAWLRDRAYPILKGVAAFYRRFPNVRRGPDGLWHIHYVNSNEGLWGGRDTDEEIASMRALFPVLIRASEILGVDAGRRGEWRDFAAHLSPLPRSDRPEVYDPVRTAGGPVWERSFLPVVLGRQSPLPDQNTLPEWFFDECNLESPPAVRALANATLDAMSRPGFGGRRPATAGAAAARRRRFFAPSRYGRRIGVLSKLPLAGVELGRVDATRQWIVSQMLGGETEILPNRMDLREGYQTMGVERLGDAADALHTALCMDLPPAPGGLPIVRLFPAWPPEWDADFRLVCRGDFVVSASQRGGRIGPVTVLARSGGEFRIRNPWPEAETVLPGGRTSVSSDRLLRIGTSAGESFELREAVAPAQAATGARAAGS